MLDRMPKDPWGRPYHYLNPGIHGSIDVWTYGVDGKPVGTGKNAEIGSWQV
jgi:general secretion pathway protein G